MIAAIGGENYKKAKASHSSGNKLGDLAGVLIDNRTGVPPDYMQEVYAACTNLARKNGN